MNDFFAGVGEGFAAGVWPDAPQERPSKKQRATVARKTAEEAGAC
jgi:hypothetical protein